MTHRLMATAVLVIAGCGGGGNTPVDGTGPDAVRPDAPGPPGGPVALAVGRGGELRSFAVEDPWSVASQSVDLGAPAASVRYSTGAFVAVHASPDDRLRRVDLTPSGLSLGLELPLPTGSDPRDIAVLPDGTGIVSLHGMPALARVDLVTGEVDVIDLPVTGAGMLAACGSRVFVQVQDPTAPAIAVVDITATGAAIVTTIPTTYPPDFAMSVDCAAQALYVAEPQPLFAGGGTHERIDLAALTAAPFPIGDGLGQVGGFVMTTADAGWFIYHTEFGPAPSSHLSLLPGHGGVWDTFADVHVDHLAYDAATSQLFYPDACTTDCNPGHATGIQVFAAATAEPLTTAAIDVGFAPVDVVIAR